jgi:hypothetical protein
LVGGAIGGCFLVYFGYFCDFRLVFGLKFPRELNISDSLDLGIVEKIYINKRRPLFLTHGPVLFSFSFISPYFGNGVPFKIFSSQEEFSIKWP